MPPAVSDLDRGAGGTRQARLRNREHSPWRFDVARTVDRGVVRQLGRDGSQRRVVPLAG